jgi:hypothetical protein
VHAPLPSRVSDGPRPTLPAHLIRSRQEHQAAKAAALTVFEQQLLGRKQGQALREQLIASMDKEGKSKGLANNAASNEVCQRLEMACTRQLDGLGRMALPSMRAFEGSYNRCKATFEVRACKRECHVYQSLVFSRGPPERQSAERLADLATHTPPRLG